MTNCQRCGQFKSKGFHKCRPIPVYEGSTLMGYIYNDKRDSVKISRHNDGESMLGSFFAVLFACMFLYTLGALLFAIV